MARLRYSSFIPSKTLWQKEIPSHWQETELRMLFADNKNKNIGIVERNLLSLSYGKLKRKDIDNATGLVPASFEGYQIIDEGYIVLRFTDLQNDKKSLRVGYVEERGIITSAYIGLAPKTDIDSKYYYYQLHFLDKIKYFYNLGGGVRQSLAFKEFGRETILIPPKVEQTTIARFLDYKLAKINRFIQKKKQLIKLLNEQKAAIINQAVTKGLDSNAKMKDSGIEWLGEIPEHWEVWRLKYLINGKLKYGANESGGDFVENHPRYIRITDFDKSGKLRDETFCSLNPELAVPYLLKEGDILFARSGGTVGKTFQFKNYEGIACYAGYLIKAEPNTTKISSDYLFAFTNSGIYDQWKSFVFNKATIENIGADKYSLLPVILPPLSEQEQIVSHIEKETAIINTTISKIEKELALTEEYKTALIAEAVTGKIDVRGYEVAEIVEEETYEEIEDHDSYRDSMAAEDGEEFENE